MGRTKLDKIFDNKFNETSPTYEPSVNFKINNIEDDVDLEDQMHYEMLFKDIDRIIKESEKFKQLLILDDNGKARKLTKIQMNELYIYIINNLQVQYRRMEVFDVITDYFDIIPARFYNALSNVFKDELLKELNDAKDIFAKKNIRRLF